MPGTTPYADKQIDRPLSMARNTPMHHMIAPVSCIRPWTERQMNNGENMPVSIDP